MTERVPAIGLLRVTSCAVGPDRPPSLIRLRFRPPHGCPLGFNPPLRVAGHLVL